MTDRAGLYAGSLYELAKEEQLTERLMEEMTALRAIFRENPEYLPLLGNPAIPLPERKKLMDEAFKEEVHPYMLNFLKLLCERSMLGDFAGCASSFEKRYMSEHGILQATVISAVELDERQKNALKEKLEKKTGKKIQLKAKTDPSLLGGLKVLADGRELDGTVKGRLAGISKALEGSSLV